AQMIKRQNVEPVRPAIIEIVFTVVCFDTERTGEFPKIHSQPLAQCRHISSISLPDVTICLWTQFIDCAALEAFGCLAKHQIQASTKSAVFIDFWRSF